MITHDLKLHRKWKSRLNNCTNSKPFTVHSPSNPLRFPIESLPNDRPFAFAFSFNFFVSFQSVFVSLRESFPSIFRRVFMKLWHCLSNTSEQPAAWILPFTIFTIDRVFGGCTCKTANRKGEMVKSFRDFNWTNFPLRTKSQWWLYTLCIHNTFLRYTKNKFLPVVVVKYYYRRHSISFSFENHSNNNNDHNNKNYFSLGTAKHSFKHNKQTNKTLSSQFAFPLITNTYAAH